MGALDVGVSAEVFDSQRWVLDGLEMMYLGKSRMMEAVLLTGLTDEVTTIDVRM